MGLAWNVIDEMPSAEPEQNFAQERYEDLCEYFKDCSDKGRGVLNDRKEFKAWLDRMKWHVMMCNELGRELEELKSAQPEKKMQCNFCNMSICTLEDRPCSRKVKKNEKDFRDME
jgi:hypothetical protein